MPTFFSWDAQVARTSAHATHRMSFGGSQIGVNLVLTGGRHGVLQYVLNTLPGAGSSVLIHPLSLSPHPQLTNRYFSIALPPNLNKSP